jgi:hypothetical protein
MKGLACYSAEVTQSIKVIDLPSERHLIQTMAKYKGILVCQLQMDCRFCSQDALFELSSQYYPIWHQSL